MAAKRISKQLKAAITDLVTDKSMTVDAAAEKHGYKPESLKTALRKPHVQQFRRALLDAHLSFAGERAICTLIALMEGAKSESVQREAAKDVAALAGIQPKTEVIHRHEGEVRAGYVIVLRDQKGDDMKTIDAATETSNDRPALTDGSDQSDQ